MNNNKLLIIICTIACLPGISSEIYAPSLPTITSALATSNQLVQMTMAVFMLGLASSQLVYGICSDGFGRKKPLLIGLIIMLIGSVASMLAPSIEVLILARFIQGCGAGACATLWRSIFRDMFSGEELARASANISIIVVFVIPAAPTLGGYLEHISWRASFVFMVVYSLISILLVKYQYSETSKNHHPERLQTGFIKKTIAQLMTSKIFIGNSLIALICYGGMIGWVTAAPVLLIDKLRLTPVEFGWVVLIGASSAMASASFINGKLVERLGMKVMMNIGFGIMICSGALCLLGYIVLGMTLWAIIVPAFLFLFGVTFIWPCSFSGAITPFGDIAGYAGALYGFMQMAGGALMAAAIAILPENNQLPIAIMFISTPILACLINKLIVDK